MTNLFWLCLVQCFVGLLCAFFGQYLDVVKEHKQCPSYFILGFFPAFVITILFWIFE